MGRDERTGTAAPETHGVLRDRTARQRKGARHGDGQEEQREEERCEAAACQEDRGSQEDHGQEEHREAAPGLFELQVVYEEPRLPRWGLRLGPADLAPGVVPKTLRLMLGIRGIGGGW